MLLVLLMNVYAWKIFPHFGAGASTRALLKIRPIIALQFTVNASINHRVRLGNTHNTITLYRGMFHIHIDSRLSFIVIFYIPRNVHYIIQIITIYRVTKRLYIFHQIFYLIHAPHISPIHRFALKCSLTQR